MDEWALLIDTLHKCYLLRASSPPSHYNTYRGQVVKRTTWFLSPSSLFSSFCFFCSCFFRFLLNFFFLYFYIFLIWTRLLRSMCARFHFSGIFSLLILVWIFLFFVCWDFSAGDGGLPGCGYDESRGGKRSKGNGRRRRRRRSSRRRSRSSSRRRISGCWNRGGTR